MVGIPLVHMDTAAVVVAAVHTAAVDMVHTPEQLLEGAVDTRGMVGTTEAWEHNLHMEHMLALAGSLEGTVLQLARGLDEELAGVPQVVVQQLELVH